MSMHEDHRKGAVQNNKPQLFSACGLEQSSISSTVCRPTHFLTAACFSPNIKTVKLSATHKVIKGVEVILTNLICIFHSREIFCRKIFKSSEWKGPIKG